MPKQLSNKQWLEQLATTFSVLPLDFHKRAEVETVANAFYNVSTSDEGEKVYTPKSTQEIHGIVLSEPHLKNTFISVFYDRVFREGMIEGLKANFTTFELFKKGDMTSASRWSRVMQGIFTTEKYDKNASPIGRKDVSNQKEVFSDFIQRRKVVFTEQMHGMDEAFHNEMSLNDLVMSWFKRVRQALNLDVRNSIRDIILTDNTAQTIADYYQLEAPFFDIIINKTAEGFSIPLSPRTAKLSDYGLASESTADQLENLIRAIALDMREPNTYYSKGDSDGKLETSIDLPVLVIDSQIYATILKNRDSIFHQNTTIEKLFSEVVPVSLGEMKKIHRLGSATNVTVDSSGNTTEQHTAVPTKRVIALICDLDAIEYKYFLDRNAQFENGNGLYINHFSHLWWATLSNPFVSSARLILDTGDSE